MTDNLSALELATLAKSLADSISAESGANDFDPTGRFRKGLHKSLKKAAQVSDAAEDMRVSMEIAGLVREETHRAHAELAKQLDANNLMVSAGKVVPRSTNLATNQSSAGTASQPVYVTVNLPEMSPQINVPAPEATKKVVTRSEDQWGEPVVTIESVPTDQ